MSEERIELTEEHFAIFKAEAEYWLDQFHLRNWEVYYGRISDDEGENAFANCVTEHCALIACLRLALYYYSTGEYEFPHDICKAAFHEVCEILLSNLHKAGSQNKILTDTMIHEVIRRLEHVVFKPDWERRQTQGEQDHGKGTNEL